MVTNQAEIDKWDQDDNLAMHYLFDSCNQDQQRSLLTCQSSREIWISLTSRYQQNSTERKLSLVQEFMNYNLKPELCMRAHIEAIKLIGQQIREAGGIMTEEEISGKILTTLPASLHYFRCSFESSPIAERTLENLTSRLVREEERLNLLHGGRSSADKAFFGEGRNGPNSRDRQRPTQFNRASLHRQIGQSDDQQGSPHFSSPQRGGNRSSPFPQRGRGRGRGSGGSNSKSSSRTNRPRDFGRCSHCSIFGHEIKDCFYKNTDAVPCGHCGKYGHEENECFSKQRGESAQLALTGNESDEFSGCASADAMNTHCSRSDILLDSGASSHMTDQQWMLNNFTPFAPNSRWINGIGKSRVAVLGKGDIIVVAIVNGVSRKLTICDVLFAPSIGINLFSVGVATAAGAEIHFTQFQAFIERDGTLEMTASRLGQRLYRLDVSILRENEAFIARPFQRSLQEWHEAFGHLNYKQIIEMHTKRVVKGLELPAGCQPPTERCHDCAKGKMHRSSFPTSNTKSERIGSLIHSDVCGPMQVNSLKGARYYVSFRDDFSGFRAVYFIKQKSEVPECCKAFIAFVHTQTGHLVVVFRTDGGTEYMPLIDWLKKKGILHQTTVRFSPQQGGRAERDNRTIVEGARTLLYSNKALPLTLWAEAVNYIVYVLNRSLSTIYHLMTPFEAWYGRKPNISNLRIFGSEFYVLIPKELRRKLDAKGSLCFFVGNTDSTKGDRYWDPITGKVNISRDVTPINHHYKSILPRPDLQKGIDVFLPNDTQAAIPAPVPVVPAILPAPAAPQLPVATIINMEEDVVQPAVQQQPYYLPVNSPHYQHHDSPPPPTDVPRRTSVRIRERRAKDSAYPALNQQTERQRKRKEYMAMSAALSGGEIEPNQYKDAMASEQAPEWMIATQKEFDSLIKNSSWALVLLPPNRSLIESRWTFKIKPGYKNKAKIYKARFVAKGFSQVAGIDYNEAEIYAPVVKHDSLRILLSIAAALDLELMTLDVKTAFLYGELDEELYVRQAEGFVQPGKENYVYRLLKPLYGLKQAPRKWNEKFDSFLVMFGLTRSTADPCIYYHVGEDPNDFIIIGIWVDDGLIASKSKSKALEIIAYLEQHFEMTSGPADSFIGLEITRDRAQKNLFLTQSTFIEKLIEKFRMTECNLLDIPADPCSYLSVANCPPEDKYDSRNNTAYRALVGALLYIMGTTRPDIAFAVIAVSRYCQNPGPAHWKAAKRILAYLRGTIHYGLCFSASDSVNVLIGYTDSNFAGCPDTRRSTTGTLYLLNEGPISWKSRLQKPVAQSTAEAEYYAAGNASCDNVWLREIVHQLGCSQPGPTPLHCDNHSAIRMVYNPEFHDRTKHIEIKYHFIRGQAQAKNLEMIPVPSCDQLADIFTKPLAGPAFKLNRSRIGVLEKPVSLQ